MEEENNENLEHGIINYKMLIDLAIQQSPKGEAGRLFREDGVKLEEIREIRIEFLNIVCLDHLWPMRNLRKLTLSQNIIEKIENLDELIELRELDLSFNRIKVMEGLNHLINLEILVLSGNEIREIEGIDDLQQLKIFSIANNIIDSSNHVMYLRKFEKLRSLNIQGNPIIEHENYINYVIAFVPQLLYLSYRMITEEQRQKSREIHRLSIAKTEENEENLRRSINDIKAAEEKKAKDAEAFVENFSGDDFFNLLFQKDKNGIALKNMSDIEIIYEEYRKKISEFSHEIYKFGVNEEVRRKNEIEMFDKTTGDEKNSVKFNARRIMNEISDHRDEVLYRLKKQTNCEEKSKNNFENESQRKSSSAQEELNFEVDMKEAQKISEDFSVFLSSKWTKLMYSEVVLHEQMEDVTESFKNNMADMIDTFVVFIGEKFKEMRTSEVDYHEKMNRIIESNVIQNSSDSVISDDMKKLFEDKEVLNNNLKKSHDLRMQYINFREETMIERIKIWFNDIIKEIITNENSRHRRRILEISHFLQIQRETLEDIFQIFNFNIDKNLEADVVAALEE